MKKTGLKLLVITLFFCGKIHSKNSLVCIKSDSTGIHEKRVFYYQRTNDLDSLYEEIKNQYNSVVISCDSEMIIPKILFRLTALKDIQIVAPKVSIDKNFIKLKSLTAIWVECDTISYVTAAVFKLKKLEILEIHAKVYSSELPEYLKEIVKKSKSKGITVALNSTAWYMSAGGQVVSSSSGKVE